MDLSTAPLNDYLPHLNYLRHIPTTFRTQALQHQVAAFDCPDEVRDGDPMAALNAPDVVQPWFLGVGRYFGP